MKTNIKKMIAVILALVMVMALSSVSAFASDEATIIIKANGNVIYEFDADEGQTVYDEIEAKKGTYSFTTNWEDVPDWVVPNLWHKSLNSINAYANTTVSMTDPRVTYQGVTPLQTPGYGEIVADRYTENGVTHYHYVYACVSWVYGPLVNGQIQDCWDYMSDYVLSDDETIVLEYRFEQTDWWTTSQIN